VNDRRGGKGGERGGKKREREKEGEFFSPLYCDAAAALFPVPKEGEGRGKKRKRGVRHDSAMMILLCERVRGGEGLLLIQLHYSTGGGKGGEGKLPLAYEQGKGREKRLIKM